MTRLITDGAEMGDTLLWENGGTNIEIRTSTPASGIYCYGCHGGDGNGYIALPITVSEIYYKARLRWEDVYWTNDGLGSNTYFPKFYMDGVDVASFRFSNPDSYLSLYVGTTEIANIGRVLSDNTWYLIELYFKIATEGKVTIKVDGVIEADEDANTYLNGHSAFNRMFYCGSYTGAMGGHTYTEIDDLAVNDTTGVVDNSWCGSGKVELLTVNGDGDLQEWTPIGGTTHYMLVDEIPYNGDTDYVYTASAAKQEMYSLASFDDTNKVVDRIWVEGRAKDNSAGGGQVKLGFKTGSTVYLQGSTLSLAGTYGRIAGDTTMLNPATGLPWDKTDLDALQVVIESET